MIKTIEQAEAALASAKAYYMDELRQDLERKDGSGAQESRRDAHKQELADKVVQCESDLAEARKRGLLTHVPASARCELKRKQP